MGSANGREIPFGGLGAARAVVRVHEGNRRATRCSLPSDTGCLVPVKRKAASHGTTVPSGSFQHSVRRVVRSSARALPGVSHGKLQALRTLRFVAFANERDPSDAFGTAGALPSLARKRPPAADTTPASRSWLVSVTRFPPTAWVRPQDDHTTPLFRLHKFPTAGGSKSPPARLVSATHRSRTIGTPRIRGRTDTSARTDPRLGTKRQRHGPHDHPFPASLRYQNQTRTSAQSRRAVCLVRTNRTRDSAWARIASPLPADQHR